MSRVLVTGANGHLGANVVRALLRRGHEVVAFVRPAADLRGLAGLKLSYAYGDVFDAGALANAAAGCEVIIHLAAVFRYWVNDGTDIIQTSVIGAQNIFAAAQLAGVRRLVYTSSTYAIGSTSVFSISLNADHWNEAACSPYAIAKVEGEREAWRLASESGIPLIVLCPAGIWGPYDYRTTPPMAWIKGLVNGTVPVIDAGGSFIDARDAAEVHALAIDQGYPGQRYILTGTDLRMTDMARIVYRLTGSRNVRLKLGKGLMLPASGLLELWARISGRPPLTTRSFVRDQLGQYFCADGRESNEIFGIKPRDAEAMISGAIRWLLFTGDIHKRKARQLTAHFPPDIEWIQTPAG